MGAFYTNLPIKEYKFLMNGETELTYDDLYDLLKNNEVSNFDPVAEAFAVYDPLGTGFADNNVLKDVFKNLGFGELSDADVKVLVSLCCFLGVVN